MAPELENAPQDKDKRDARSHNEVCSGKQQGAAQRLRGVRAAAGTGLRGDPRQVRQCADHTPRMIDQATKTLENALRRKGMLD